MNNEIKEILDYLSDDSKSFIICGVSYYKISDYKAKVLLDYITELQEELEEEKRIEQEDLKTIMNLQEENEKIKLENKVLKEQMVAMVQPNYTYEIR